MIVLFTDFGWQGPYVGQMKAVLACEAPSVPVVDLMHDAPVYSSRAAAYLLAALLADIPAGAVCLCVVDPGVGSTTREPVAIQADGRWFVGPDNGLFTLIAQRASQLTCWRITWRPTALSASFHGRDLFAPVAARLARGEPPPGERGDGLCDTRGNWPEELAEIIYVDHYGNAMSGLRASGVHETSNVCVSGHTLRYCRTFSEAEVGEPFWYKNALGLLEIAVNQGSAAQQLGLLCGVPLTVVPSRSR